MKGPLFAFILLAFIAGLAMTQPVPNTPGFEVLQNPNYTLVSQSGQSALYRLSVGSAYDDQPYFVRLQGSRFQMGKDFATLAGQDVLSAVSFVLKKHGVTRADEILVKKFAIQQWAWLAVATPSQYLEELSGIQSQSQEVWEAVVSVLVLANLPSDLPEDLLPILKDEQENPDYLPSNASSSSSSSPLTEYEQARLLKLLSSLRGLSCSMFAVWGSRTVDKNLFTCRNLDYGPDSGVNGWKSITMWVPDDGSIAHVAYGFLPLYGVLSGNSAAGITVHEANLEEANETFRGFPWVIRLRYILENARTLAEANVLWMETNNTVGYNHMVASLTDAQLGGLTAAVVYETSAFYSSPFYANDPVEADARHNGEQYGFPLPEALWRTNHPYDAFLSDNYLWWTFGAYRWSQQRYMFIYETILNYEQQGTPIGPIEALNITSIVADKGQQSPYLCSSDSTLHGENILSVMHQPLANVSYVAWDNGASSTWTPACCNTYVLFNHGAWW